MEKYFVAINPETLEPTFYNEDGVVVPFGDAGFIAWLGKGNIPEPWELNN